jgi:hypothetical protein
MSIAQNIRSPSEMFFIAGNRKEAFSKLLILGKDGSPKKEMPIKPLSYRFKPLANGKFFFWRYSLSLRALTSRSYLYAALTSKREI